mgnify:FL=1
MRKVIFGFALITLLSTTGSAQTEQPAAQQTPPVTGTAPTVAPPAATEQLPPDSTQTVPPQPDWAENSDTYKECEKTQKQKYGEPKTLDGMQELLKALLECKKSAISEQNSNSRYHVFYNKCKSMRFRQAKTVGAQEAARRLKYCKEWAEQYELSAQTAGLQVCELKSCFENAKLTACENSYRIVGPIGVRPCRTIYAALACMEKIDELKEEYPSKVFWKTDSREGSILCDKI